MISFISSNSDIITAIFRIVGLVLLTFFVIPKAIKEVKVKDGLAVIRWNILIGILIFGVSGAVFLTNIIASRLGFFSQEIMIFSRLLGGLQFVSIIIVIMLMQKDRGRIE